MKIRYVLVQYVESPKGEPTDNARLLALSATFPSRAGFQLYNGDVIVATDEDLG